MLYLLAKLRIKKFLLAVVLLSHFFEAFIEA